MIRDSGQRAPPPPFTEEHEELRETIGRFVRAEIAPNVDEWEEAREFPRELFARAGELGFLGLKYPEELGGQGGDYVHDAVCFITNGVRADLLVCAVRTSEEGGHRALSFLVLERDTPGYEVSRKLEKMGWHASDTGELSFTDIEVPAENLLGEENGGFYLIMANFAWERLLMSLGAVGAMQRLFEVTLAYAKERQAFGRSIGRFQAIRHKFAEMATTIEVARTMTYSGLRHFAAGADAIQEVTETKLLTQRAAVGLADECLQIHGGYGYMREYGIERAVRDLRLGPIGGGTDEIMKEIIGRRLGL